MNYLGFDPRKMIDPSLEHEIRLRAYDLYCCSGKRDGHALDDWLQAEHQVLREKRPHRVGEQTTKIS